MKNSLRWLGLITLPIMVSACSTSVPDWADPTEWFEDSPENAPERVTNAEEAVPAADFPNLATVPGEAPSVSADALREQRQQGLIADHGNAEYSNEPLTANSTLVAPAPAPDAPAAPVLAPVTAAPSATVTPSAPAAPAAQAANGSAPAVNQVVRSQSQQAPVPAAQNYGGTTVISSGGTSGSNGLPPAFPNGAPSAYAAAPSGPTFNTPSWAATSPAYQQGRVSPYQQGYQPQYQPQTYATATQSGFLPYGGAVLPSGRLVAVIYFDHGSANLDGRDRNVLRDIATLYGQTGGQVRVVGHSSSRTQLTDLSTHQQANYQISEARARAVSSVLAGQGIPAQLIATEARADSNPVFHEFMPTGEAGNRRVEIYLN
ncbi:OmpA family protein [Kiloniella sp. b19]|uniref:OmpA family protein n=1 Tax=Kiloniella sp. GXU_MW_B19 TaxID=3141326 RepID=UPI0031D91B04